jgi:glycogen synthase
VGTEVAPWSKAGGLGDVMDALPIALAARGVSVMSIAPAYQPYEDTKDTGLIIPLADMHPAHASPDNDHEQARLCAVVAKGVLRVFVSHPLLNIPEGKDIYCTYTSEKGEARDVAAGMQVSYLLPACLVLV